MMLDCKSAASHIPRKFCYGLDFAFVINKEFAKEPSKLNSIGIAK